MANDWTTKEKIVLLSDILEYGDQPESWSSISNDLSRTFRNNMNLSQTKREDRYSIKNCKQEYKNLVNRYKFQWTEHGSSNSLKLPLAKYIWIQLKSIYQGELTQQLNESRKKLTEFCLRLESAVNIKPNIIIESTVPSSITEITTTVTIPQENEPQQIEKPSTIENISQSIKLESDISQSESIQLNSLDEANNTTQPIADSSKQSDSTILLTTIDESQIKEEPQSEIRTDTVLCEIADQSSSIDSQNLKVNLPIVEEDISQQTLIESPSQNISSDQQLSISQTLVSNAPLLTSTNATTRSESVSSSRSTSRTSSETKTDVVRVVSVPTTTPKYHVYFSPKNSITNNSGTIKIKPKRKATDDIKDENENDSPNQPDITSTLSTTTISDQSKVPSTTAPMTRRSINTRSVPNTAAEQEEEKSRRFSLMLSENPSSWQSQSMAIIQFILAHKQGYLFEHEITEEIAPKYHQYIRHPIALDTIRKTLESNGYQTKEHFRRDIYLMLYNAMKYNPRYHHVHRSAKNIFNTSIPLFNLSAQEIHGQIVTKSNASLATPTNDIPPAKRKRTK